MSNLEEENRKLKEENNALKLVVGNFASRFEGYFNDADNKTDDKTDERPKPDYSALLKELEFNDEMFGKETTKGAQTTVPPIYQKLLEELRENDELLNNTIK